MVGRGSRSRAAMCWRARSRVSSRGGAEMMFSDSGTGDEWSDIDIIVFYEAWPEPAAIDTARAGLELTGAMVIGGTPDGPLLEQFWIEGIAFQVVHQTIAMWKEHAATVLEKLDT